MTDKLEYPANLPIWKTPVEYELCTSDIVYMPITIIRDPYGKGGSISINGQQTYVSNLTRLANAIAEFAKYYER